MKSHAKGYRLGLMGSIFTSTFLLSYLLGQAVGSNRFGDSSIDNALATLGAALFVVFTVGAAWFLHLFVDVIAQRDDGILAPAGRWLIDLPAGLRVLLEFLTALILPLVLLVVPMFLAFPWWR